MLTPANRVESTLAVAYTQGTSTEITLASVANCPAKSVVCIDDGVEWCLVKYALVDTPKLKTLTNPLAVYESASANGHEFPIGTKVCIAAAADLVEQLLLEAATDKTIAGGAITVDSTKQFAAYLVDTEGAAGSDDLATINGGAEGMLILLRAKDATHTVVAKHDTDNILTAGADISLDDTYLYILLAYDTALTKWVVVGGGGGSMTTNAKARAYSSVNQAEVETNVMTVIELDLEVYDPGSNFNTTTDRFIASIAGYYGGVGAVTWLNADVVDGKQIVSGIAVNGVAVAETSQIVGAAGEYCGVVTAGQFHLNIGDYVQLIGRHKFGSNSTVFASVADTFFAIHLLSFD